MTRRRACFLLTVPVILATAGFAIGRWLGVPSSQLAAVGAFGAVLTCYLFGYASWHAAIDKDRLLLALAMGLVPIIFVWGFFVWEARQ
jgi:hypothetical protein